MAKLNNAPVYFTIAQVRFNPILSLESYLADLQDKLRRAGYPDYKPLHRISINLSGGTGKDGASLTQSQVVRHVFANTDGNAGFLVEQNSISFQTTSYDVFGTFSAEFFRGVEVLHELVGLSFTERVGLRYLDAVIPKKGEEISLYLVPEVMGLQNKLPGIEHSYTETMARDDGNHVISRTLIHKGELGLPPDLDPIGLKLSGKFSGHTGLHAILDTDAFCETRKPFDANALKERMSALHEFIRKAFKAIPTEYAQKVWSEE